MHVTIPDSPTAQAAAELARAAAPPFLLNHSYRTYLFGVATVTEDVDHEAAFVASMIHDLGLTDEHRGTQEFGVVGADVAGRFLSDRGWEPRRIRLVEQAILRHTNLQREDVPTYRVVQAGATVDVVGLGLDAIERDELATVLRAYPRLGFVSEMRAAFLDEAHRHPDGVFAKLESAVGISDLFAQNPIDRR
jgi:hypothetical protein